MEINNSNLWIVVVTAAVTLLTKDVFWSGIVKFYNTISKTKSWTNQQFRKYLAEKVEEQSKIIISQTAIIAEQTLTIKAQTLEINDLKELLVLVRSELNAVKRELDEIRDKQRVSDNGKKI